MKDSMECWDESDEPRPPPNGWLIVGLSVGSWILFLGAGFSLYWAFGRLGF